MGFFDALNGGLESMFQQAAKSKRLQSNRRQGWLDYLQKEQHFLVDSNFLLELTDGASKEEGDLILDYMYRFRNDDLDILGVESYKEVENKIIQGRWK